VAGHPNHWRPTINKATQLPELKKRDDSSMEAPRVDRWLWAVRIYKTRTSATAGCRAGRVSINGDPAKPADKVHVGDLVSVRLQPNPRILEVVQLIDKRGSATLAASCLIDRSPAPEPRGFQTSPFTRDPSTGRPTKKERRALDRVRGR
jgi:ribosome-associated heat shock protein Hsp15